MDDDDCGHVSLGIWSTIANRSSSIKYMPYVADSKRALDEYPSEIFMGGLNTIVLHNTCEV